MKITRALLLSSKKQAELWEHEPYGIFKRRTYRYLVEDRYGGANLRFSIFCVRQEQEKGTVRMQDIVATEPHVEESFSDMGKLINFLHRYQIDFQECWQPVED